MLKPHQTSLRLPWACLHCVWLTVCVGARGMCVQTISVPMHLLIGGQRGYLYKGHEVSFQVWCVFIHAWFHVCARAWAFSSIAMKSSLKRERASSVFGYEVAKPGATMAMSGCAALIKKGCGPVVWVPMTTVNPRFHSKSQFTDDSNTKKEV